MLGKLVLKEKKIIIPSSQQQYKPEDSEMSSVC